MGNILIATIYHDHTVKLALKEFKISKAIILKDDEPNQMQEDAIKKLKEYNASMIDFDIQEIPKYDIKKIVKKSIQIIEAQPENANIYVDVTQGKRTQFLGLLFACYKNHDKIKKILYGKEIAHDKYELITLPKFSFKTKDSELLKALQKGSSPKQIIEEKQIVSRGTFYNKMEEFESNGFIEKTTEGYKLTDSGEIMALKWEAINVRKKREVE